MGNHDPYSDRRLHCRSGSRGMTEGCAARIVVAKIDSLGQGEGLQAPAPLHRNGNATRT